MTSTYERLQTPITVTLPEGKWDTIRTAVLCFACDERTRGYHPDAAHWMEAYKALKEAMGD